MFQLVITAHHVFSEDRSRVGYAQCATDGHWLNCPLTGVSDRVRGLPPLPPVSTNSYNYYSSLFL
jgi:hypothetical protein